MGTVRTVDFKKSIYVLLYHPWMDGFEQYFAAHLSWLREDGFESIPLERIIQYLKGEDVAIPERPIAITLDDGTIETYTIAYPLLRKYGFAATVFAPTADRYIKFSGKDWWKEVESEGILRIEGHSHTHSFIFVNDWVDRFHIREKEDREPIIKGLDRRPGAPIFGLGYELISQRFFPRSELMDRCADHVRQNGETDFFERRNWKEELIGVVSRYAGDRGRFETVEEKKERIKEELELSKRIIEEVIGGGKRVRFFAYPFGAYDSDVVEGLKNSGYNGAFTTDSGGNHTGDDPFLIKRMTIQEENSFGGLPHLLEDIGKAGL